MYYIGYLLAGGTGSGVRVCIFWCFGWLFLHLAFGLDGILGSVLVLVADFMVSSMGYYVSPSILLASDSYGAFKADSHTMETVPKPALI
jgi:hypothetical protein